MAENSNLQDQTKMGTPSSASETEAQNNLRLSAFDLKDQSRGITINSNDTNMLALAAFREIAREALVGGAIDFSACKEEDDKALATWNRFEKNARPGGIYTSLTVDIRLAAEKRSTLLGEDFPKTGTTISRLVEEVKTLRRRELEDGVDDYLLIPMRHCYLAAAAVGYTSRKKDIKDDSLIGYEVQRQMGYSQLKTESNILETAIFEHLRPFFYGQEDQWWTDENPWTDEQKKAAIQKIKDATSHNPAGEEITPFHLNERELEWLHNRFLVSAVNALTMETGKRLYLQPTERALLNKFILVSMGKDLKVDGNWTAGLDDVNVAKKYGLTKAFAAQLHNRVMDIKMGRVRR